MNQRTLRQAAGTRSKWRSTTGALCLLRLLCLLWLHTKLISCTATGQHHIPPLCRPYNKIKNWDYVKLIEAMYNGEGELYAVRVSKDRAVGSPGRATGELLS